MIQRVSFHKKIICVFSLKLLSSLSFLKKIVTLSFLNNRTDNRRNFCYSSIISETFLHLEDIIKKKIDLLHKFDV